MSFRTTHLMANRLLITGGAGFIGSHTCVVLLEQGYELVVLDSFDNSSPVASERVKELCGSQALHVLEGDIRNAETVDQAFRCRGTIDGVEIHFAGLKAVGESVANPLLYWDVNLNGSRVLAAAMERHSCRTLVFSSTATVYGEPDQFPLREDSPTAPIHPYAQTKVAVEQMLQALCRQRNWRVASLRYFNPVGPIPAGGSEKTPLESPTICSRSSPRWRPGVAAPAHLRFGLPDTRWNRHPRLFACDGPRRSPLRHHQATC